MTRTSVLSHPDRPAAELRPLCEGRIGLAGVIAEVSPPEGLAGGVDSEELQRRLLEMGFVEGARIEILHEGFIGRDPICVKLDDMRIALRRSDAKGILVRPDARP